MNDQEQKNASYKDLFIVEDVGYIDVDEDKPFDAESTMHQFYFFTMIEGPSAFGSPDVTKIRSKYHPFIGLTPAQVGTLVDNLKEICLKLTKNVNLLVEQVLAGLVEARASKFLRTHEMKLLRKLFIYGSRMIQHQIEMFASEKEKVNDNIRRFAKIFQTMKTL